MVLDIKKTDKSQKRKKIVVSITGASGIIYAKRLLEILSSKKYQTNYSVSVLISDSASKVAKSEKITLPKPDFKIDDFSLNKTASQGQQKTFLIALKFAEFSFIQKVSKLKPILLLDDIFDKFDRKRVRKIMELTTGDDFGQIFISDTSKERVANILSETGIEYKLFELEKGSVTEK